jgi:hypothetical protein
MRIVQLVCLVFVLMSGAWCERSWASIQGNADYTIDGSTITFTVDKICRSNLGSGTGALTIQLYASQAPYSGGTLSGYVIGETAYPSGSGCIIDIDRNETLRPPPDGTWYITMVLLEPIDGSLRIIDYRTFKDPVAFKAGAVVQAPADHGDSCHDPSYVSIDSVIPANLDTPGDKDFFAVELTQPGLLTISTSGLTDTKGILRAACKPVAADKDSGSGTNFRITESLAPGVYTIEVESQNNDSGDYSLNIVWTADSHGVSYTEHCVPLNRNFGLPLRYARYSQIWLQCLLDFYPHPGDPAGLYWRLDPDTLDGLSIPPLFPAEELVYIGANLEIGMCVTYAGQSYRIKLDHYPNPDDGSSLYWKFDPSAISVYEPPD